MPIKIALMAWISVALLLIEVGGARGQCDCHPPQLAIALVGRQVLAFSSISNTWSVLDLAARERVVEQKEGSDVAVVVTNTRVLGFSAMTSQWSQVTLQSGEVLVEVRARGRAAEVITSLRALGFGARRGIWSIKRLHLK